MSATNDPVHVCVTGAAGQIGYALVFRIANGDMFGKDTPVVIHMLDIPPVMEALNGVALELEDGAFPLLAGTIATDDLEKAFTDIDVAVLVGAMPRREGMERADLLKANAGIFETQGKALDQFAKKSVKVLVVGNPANTNCLLALRSAPSLSPSNFTALTRLDQNRATAQIAAKCNVGVSSVKNVTIWGNHSKTQYPFVGAATVTVNGTDVAATEAVNDSAWLQGEFIETVQTRGAAIIKARKLSSAGSAANAIIDHVRDWWTGLAAGTSTSMGVWSDGNPYGVPEGLIFSFPVAIGDDGTWSFVEGIEIDEFSQGKLNETAAELAEERDSAVSFLSSQL